jgi:radical SAM superfamily enzyme YgiQ (UPF0313 family)
MTIKKPSERKKVTAANVDALANKLADRTFGEDKSPIDEIVRTSISLPKSLLQEIEDLSILNKRDGKGLKNISAIVRAGLDLYLANIKK